MNTEMPAGYDAWKCAAPEGEDEKVCKECAGGGWVCVGDSGTEADGYAPILERCEACDGSGTS